MHQTNNRSIMITKELLAESLTALLDGDKKLGFVDSVRDKPMRRRVWVNTKHYQTGKPNTAWYMWNTEKDSPEFPPSHILKGYVTGVGITQSEHRNKPVDKLVVNVDAGDKLYQLYIGLETYFAKSIMYSLATVSNPESLITIELAVGDSENVVFARVYENGQYLKNEDNASFESIQNQVYNKFPDVPIYKNEVRSNS